MGYIMGIIGTIVLVAVIIAIVAVVASFRKSSGEAGKKATHVDYREGRTYAEPIEEEVQPKPDTSRPKQGNA